MGRRGPRSAGTLIRTALTPMAARIGIDYDEAFVVAPRDEAAVAFEVVRCGAQLVVAFTYPDAWPESAGGTGAPKRVRRKAAEYLEAMLQTDYGRDGISWMAQRYATVMAETWRRAAAHGEHGEQAAQLHASADASERLGRLAHLAWPVSDADGVLAHIASATANRFFDPDNPSALIDMQAYAQHAEATAEALALAVAPRYDSFAEAIIGPVMGLNLEYHAGLQADWNLAGEYWANLLSPEPLSYGEMVHIVATGHGA